MNRTTGRSSKYTQSRSRSRTANSSGVRGKRKSVKADAQKRAKLRGGVNSRNLKRVRDPRRSKVMRAFAAVIIILAIVALGAFAMLFQNDSSKYSACEKWRDVVAGACNDCELNANWTDCLLAIMVIESGGDEHVDSVIGVDGDIMQAGEGAYGWIVTDGWPEHNASAETPTASIYAGVMEFKQNLELWEGYLGTITTEDTTEIQLVIQGYNFGADGWFSWCKNKGVTAYTVELAQEYSSSMMPANAKGTPTHAQKWLNAYTNIHTT